MVKRFEASHNKLHAHETKLTDIIEDTKFWMETHKKLYTEQEQEL